MELTRITDGNKEFFDDLLPDRYLGEGSDAALGVLDEENSPCAAMALTIKNNMLEISWLYTYPDYRAEGAGSLLFDKAMELIDGMELDGVETTFSADDLAVRDFLTDKQFLIARDRGLYKVPVSDLIYEEDMDRIREASYDSHPVATPTDNNAKNMLIAYMEKLEIPEEVYEGYSEKYSFLLKERDEIGGVILTKEIEGGDLEVLFFHNGLGVGGVMDLCKALADVLDRNEKAGNYLYFSDREGSSSEFVERLTGEDADRYRIDGIDYAVRLFA